MFRHPCRGEFFRASFVHRQTGKSGGSEALLPQSCDDHRATFSESQRQDAMPAGGFRPVAFSSGLFGCDRVYLALARLSARQASSLH